MNTSQMNEGASESLATMEPPVWTRLIRSLESRGWTVAAAFTVITLVVFAIFETSRNRQVDPYGPPVAVSNSASAALASRPDSSHDIVSLNRPQEEGKPQIETRITSKTLQPSSAATPLIAHAASMTILVKDFAQTRSSLDTILAKHNGYSAVLRINTPESGQREFQASLRIPTTELTSTFADLKSLGRMLNESQSGEEVTQQHADLVARLQNSHETEQRLQAILQQRTGKIEDVLQVEEELSRVRGEIESMDAERKTLEHRVTFATIDLQLVEEYTEKFNSSTSSTTGRIRNAFIQGIRNATETILALILFFEEFGPAILIWAGILSLPAYFIRRRYGRIRAKTS